MTVMLDRSVLGAALAALLALPAAAQGPGGAPPAGAAEEPCEPVVPCEIPDEPAAPPADAPADFTAEAKLLFALVSCSGAPLPPALDAAVVGAFCARQGKALAAYRAGRLPAASAALARLRPPGLPTTVIQPFGGDLLTALAAFPDLRNVTTISSARAGDPRRLVATRSPAELGRELERVRAATARLLGEAGGRDGSADPLALDMVALAAHGFQPVSLRFFRIERDGSLHHLTRAELSAAGSAQAPGFAGAELVFVKEGEDPRSRARTHRLVAAELSDAAMARSPGVAAHLSSKGEVVALVTGAGPRLRRADAGKARDLVLRQAVFVLADAAAPFPLAGARGRLVQEAHGAYVVARRP